MILDKKPTWPLLSSVSTIVFDFDGVFTNNKVYVTEEGKEFIQCDRADGLALDFIRRYQAAGLLTAEVFILSTEKNPVVLARAAKLKLACHVGVTDKLAFLEAQLGKQQDVDVDPWKQLIYLGNDLNDLLIMSKAGFSVAPSDAHSRVQEIASVVLPRCGGDGFVRFFVEKLLGIEMMTKEKLNECFFNR